MNDLVFAMETPKPLAAEREDAWKVLISDDENDVHDVTVLALKGVTFEGRPLQFFHAHTAKQTYDILHSHTDIALVLQDVVMETDDAGLELVRRIRRELKNQTVRIVLRTGQPGRAPERQVVLDYDINDYKEKTELTRQKLFTTVISALRSYNDIRTIERNRDGLTKIINASGNLFNYRSIQEFAQGVLMQITALLKVDEGSLSQSFSGLTASAASQDDRYVIVSGTGTFEEAIGRPIEEVVQGDALEMVNEAVSNRISFFRAHRFVGYFETSAGFKTILFIAGKRHIGELDRKLLLTFFSNISIAFENLYLHNEVKDIQLSVIETLGQVIENRSRETANHTRRIGHLAALLAEKLEMTREQIEMLRIAAPMHDIGKIAVPDEVLGKPAGLTEKEYDIMKTHTLVGYDIFKNTDRDPHRIIAAIAHQHHEHWDGSGYPQGLAGEQINVFARITTIVDSFDALTHKRPYKDPWELQRVKAYITEQRGVRFDPHITDVFLRHIGEFVTLAAKYPG